MNYKNLTKEYIEEQLYQNKKTLSGLARELNIKVSTLGWRAKKLGVKSLSRSEANERKKNLNITKAILEDLYIIQKKKFKEIAKILNCCEATVCKKLKEFNIKARNQTDYGPWNKGTKGLYKNPNSYFKKGMKAWNKGLTKETDERVAKQVEKLSAIRKVIFKGEGNPFYNKKHKEEWKKEQSLRKGGTGVPYEFNEYGSKFTEELKEIIRNRDGRKCQLCNCDERDCIVKLHVHHIDYDKKNCNPSNLVSLCGSCHTATNTNREYWKIVFNKDLMISRRESALHDYEL